MKLILAPDSFKECLSARAVAAALARGWRRRLPATTIVQIPMADGGEGTLDCLAAALHGRRAWLRVAGPLGEPVRAPYLWVPASRTVVIESASACGLMLVPPARRNPLLTSTLGVGELLRAALRRQPREILLTIGGSATVDGGTGLARALGWRFLDGRGRELPLGGGALTRLHRVVPPATPPMAGVRLRVACDVRNPLLGPQGAARVFGPQKGATPALVRQLERGLAQFHRVLAEHLGRPFAHLPGAGAAGGLGAGLLAMFDAELVPGVDLVMAALDLPRHLAGASLVITGEGRSDTQTLGGKVASGVARAAQTAGVPCVLVAGSLEDATRLTRELKLAAALSCSPGPMPLPDALQHARQHLEATAFALAGLWVTKPG